MTLQRLIQCTALLIFVWILSGVQPAEAQAIRVRDGAEAVEGGPLVFTITRTTGQPALTLTWTARPDNFLPPAQLNVDYRNESGTVSFAANQTSVTVSVQTIEDNIDEFNEAVELDINAPDGTQIMDDRAFGIINDNDNAPVITTSGTSTPEGNSGQTNATLTLSLDRPSANTVTVSVATDNNTATGGSACGGSVDFVHRTGPVSFAPGTVRQTMLIPVCGETTVEPDEFYTVKLAGPQNATIGTASANATIKDDDGLPVMRIASVNVNEGQTATFNVTLSIANPSGASVKFSAGGGKATGSKLGCVSGIDYIVPAPGTLTFSPSETRKTIQVTTCRDSIDETGESFTITLSSPTGATLGTSTASANIIEPGV